MHISQDQLIIEFNKQIDTLIQNNFPKLLGIPENDFLTEIKSLEESMRTLSVKNIDLENGYLPFIIVPKFESSIVANLMELIVLNGKKGIEKLFPHKPEQFKIIESANIPEKKFYLLVDIDRGKESLNLAPNEAMKLIIEAKRSPLTMEEGIAILIQYPGFLMKNNCFSLLASRIPDNKCVPAIWINGKKQANLGWCWNGNPHTWLGSASCRVRI